MLSTVIGLATGPKKLIVLAIGAALVLGYIGWLKLSIAWLERALAFAQSDLATARANVDAAVDINEANLLEIERLRADSSAVRTALGGELAALERRCTLSQTVKREVSRVAAETPASCPVAPSVRAALRGLQPAGAGGADRHEDRAGGRAPAR